MPGLGHIQPAILGLPVVDRRFRHTVLPGKISDLRARVSFLTHADYPFLGKPLALHRLSFLKAGL